MKYYSIQKLVAWNVAKEKGFLTGSASHVDEDWFLKSYQWMEKQMVKRLKDYQNEQPIWLWLDPCNINFIELLQDDYVLLEIELQDDQVLVSNFQAWHIILNDWNFEEDGSAISKEEAWEYIFDKEKMAKLDFTFDIDELQGVVGKVDLKDIKVLKYIVSDIYNN